VKVPLLAAMADWYCPNCWVRDTAPPPPPGQVRFHTCPGLHGLTAPLVRAGTGCKVEAVERQDYLAGEVQRTGDDGKPYAGVRTERPDGSNDLAAFAPLARASIREVT
jgi:hypothetical protein